MDVVRKHKSHVNNRSINMKVRKDKLDRQCKELEQKLKGESSGGLEKES